MNIAASVYDRRTLRIFEAPPDFQEPNGDAWAWNALAIRRRGWTDHCSAKAFHKQETSVMQALQRLKDHRTGRMNICFSSKRGMPHRLSDA